MVTPDSGPLISFGKIDRMDLIGRLKRPIIITDVVQMEITDGPDDATNARVLADWMQQGHLNVWRRPRFEAERRAARTDRG